MRHIVVALLTAAGVIRTGAKAAAGCTFLPLSIRRLSARSRAI
jgi:hypothetical protein